MTVDSIDKSGEELLRVEHLVQRYQFRGRAFEAVSDISFGLRRGETLGLVGESGCGKSTTGRALLRLPTPTQGSVIFDGRELTTMPDGEFRQWRRRMTLIFQDSVSALNPRRRIRDIVAEGLVIAGDHHGVKDGRVDEALELVGLKADEIRDRRSHELSGGQCQRVAIARALILKPELLICDEPVASLDVSVQGQVLNLLEGLRRRFGLSMVFISHNLSVIHNVSDRIAVMYLGKLVEVGDADTVSHQPAHPYTRALLDAVPPVDPDAPRKAAALVGEMPSPFSPPSGCRFRTRCPLAQSRCANEEPQLREVSQGRSVACHFPLIGDISPSSKELSAEIGDRQSR